MRYGRSNFFLGKPLLKRILCVKYIGYMEREFTYLYDKSPNATVHFIRKKLHMHNGRSFSSYVFNKWSCGYKIGEFVWTRKIAFYKAKKLKKKKLKNKKK